MRAFLRQVPVILLGVMLWQVKPEQTVWLCYREAVAETNQVACRPVVGPCQTARPAVVGPCRSAAAWIWDEMQLASGMWSGKEPSVELEAYVRMGMLPTLFYTAAALGLEGE